MFRGKEMRKKEATGPISGGPKDSESGAGRFAREGLPSYALPGSIPGSSTLRICSQAGFFTDSGFGSRPSTWSLSFGCAPVAISTTRRASWTGSFGRSGRLGFLMTTKCSSTRPGMATP